MISVLAGSLAYIKEVRDKCAARGIDAVAAAPAPGRGWGTKAHLLVEEVDIARVSALLQDEWHAMLAREGNAPVAAGGDACPACGCAAPLVEGACADCGLQLE